MTTCQCVVTRSRSNLQYASAFLVTAALLSAAVSSDLSTLAISHVPNAILVCALVLPPGDDAIRLHCTSLPDGRLIAYPSASNISYSAVAAGSGFLCGLMSPSRGLHTAMRWWSFNRSIPIGSRLYRGPSLRGLSAGGRHVCGISDSHDPTCWGWPGLRLPPGLNLTQIALGNDFLCGIDAPHGIVHCFGGDEGITHNIPPGSFKTISAGWRHACSVRVDGAFVCWGDSRPDIPDGELPRNMWSMALGDNLTCILSGGGTIRCWGSSAVSVPEEYVGVQFVAIQADGNVVCGVAAASFSVVCWGSRTTFEGRHLVYNGAMPGACAPRMSCSCGIFEGSGILCSDDYAVCRPCTVPLYASDVSMGNGIKSTVVVVALCLTVVGLGVVAAVGLALHHVLLNDKCDRKIHVSVRLRESSSRRLCHKVETAIIMRPLPSPRQHPLPAMTWLGCEEFSLKELIRVTDGFSEGHRVGKGSFGSVYRARLPDGREVAVKRASSGVWRHRRCDTERAFRVELKLLSRVNHRNLVRLIGFCEERGERILVLEFLHNGSLHVHLHDQRSVARSPLFASWEARLRVALDAARGVEYLHCYAVPRVMHRDIKPSNILLDAEWTAKVSDFGLSMATTGNAAPACSTAGTVGYMDPEYYRLQELTERSDVYSFGVVLLELITGRKAIERRRSGSPMNVIEFAVPAVEVSNISKVLDVRVAPPRAGHEAKAVASVARIAAECVRAKGRGRPVMPEVVAELEWAVALCEEGSLSRSRSRSVSDDPSEPELPNWCP